MMINGKSVEESFVDLASSFSELAKIVTASLINKIHSPEEPTAPTVEVQDIPEEFHLEEVEFEEDMIPKMMVLYSQ